MSELGQTSDGKIVCQIDGARTHSVQIHIKENHADWTIERYKETYPDAPVLSEKAKSIWQQRQQQKAAAVTSSPVVLIGDSSGPTTSLAPMHEIFGFGDVAAAKSKTGNAVAVTVLGNHPQDALPYMADLDPNYVFNIDLVRKIIIGLELNLNVYLWGMHGTGKTTALEQCASRTKRPFLRVQHTINTEESHILGQYVVRDGATAFEPGPLPLAMRNGWIYCADEYDFAMPSVTAVYQPVLEHKNLIIKEAPPEWRVVKPHKQFRFVATGNTNGIGDETGLYQGTLIGNAANYSRFEITEEVGYMEAKVEESVVMGQTQIDRKNAEKLVKFANLIRTQFGDGKISMTISPRELINSARLCMAYSGDMNQGLQLAFANRLSRIDKKVVSELSGRIFGS